MQFWLCENCLLLLLAIPASLLKHLHSRGTVGMLIFFKLHTGYKPCSEQPFPAPWDGLYSFIPAELGFYFFFFQEHLYWLQRGCLQHPAWRNCKIHPETPLCPWFQWWLALSRCPGSQKHPELLPGLIHKAFLSAKPGFSPFPKVRRKFLAWQLDSPGWEQAPGTGGTGGTGIQTPPAGTKMDQYDIFCSSEDIFTYIDI